MKTRRFAWGGAAKTARAVREWTAGPEPVLDVAAIGEDVLRGGDEAVLRLTARFDATQRAPQRLRVEAEQARAALGNLDSSLLEAMKLAAENVRAVAEAQLIGAPGRIELAQGHSVTIREVAVSAAGLYAPGGRGAYPSSVLMCAIPAQVAGVGRLALASPPGPDGKLNPLVLAAAQLCQIDEIYAMGGAQAIFALAHGTETIDPVDVIAGPGNAWVREAKRAVTGLVGIDSLAGPSELMLVAGRETNPDWAALDLCAQAEHGAESPLMAVAIEEAVLNAIATAAEGAAAARPTVADARLALVRIPDLNAAIELANAFSPEHLELMEPDAALLAEQVKTAGCVFAGRGAATAFGDYVAGSNHVLPTAGAGRFSGPLSPAVFRRSIPTVEIPEAAVSALAPRVEALSRAEGFPVHGESAMIRR